MLMEVRVNTFSTLLAGLLFGLASSCTTVEPHTGFALSALEGDRRCRVLSYNGEVIVRENKANGNRSAWGVGKCPRLLPGGAGAKIWRQARITVPTAHVATLQTKRNPAGVVQTITIRRNHNYKRPGQFSYVWFKHHPN